MVMVNPKLVDFAHFFGVLLRPAGRSDLDSDSIGFASIFIEASNPVLADTGLDIPSKACCTRSWPNGWRRFPGRDFAMPLSIRSHESLAENANFERYNRSNQ